MTNQIKDGLNLQLSNYAQAREEYVMTAIDALKKQKKAKKLITYPGSGALF